MQRSVEAEVIKPTHVADALQNTYLININITNKQKDKYYQEYVPDLLDVSLIS